MMRRVLFLALALAHTPAEKPSPSSCKPFAPIDLDAAIVGDPGSPFGITARASSRLGVPLDLEIVLPDGVTAHGGQAKASGRVCETRLEASALDRSRREILVRASFTQGTATMVRVVSLVLFDRPAPAPKAPLKTNARGETILEYS
ncbi:MAG TPA: hypothetical protein VKW04_20280, partial [Planctomycetota bacterium]|nr:hypothetical protein [Planctomycetota bacterium]